MKAFNLSILCTALIFFHYSEVSWGGNGPSREGNSRRTERDLSQLREFMSTYRRVIGTLQEERLRAIRDHFTATRPSEALIKRELIRRLKYRYQGVEKEYLAVLKGLKKPNPQSIQYTPGSEESELRELMTREEPVALEAEPRSMSHDAPWFTQTAHKVNSRRGREALRLTNQIRVLHDDTRAMSDSLDRAQMNEAETSRDDRDRAAIHSRAIRTLKTKLREAHGKQEEAISSGTLTNIGTPYNRDSVDDQVREALNQFPQSSSRRTRTYHYFSQRTQPSARSNHYAAYVPNLSRSHDVASRDSLDTIDVIYGELVNSRATRDRLRGIPREIYGQSIEKLERTLELARRYRDNIVYHQMIPADRLQYIPGSAELDRIRAFEEAGLHYV